jgi:hypothetical protein
MPKALNNPSCSDAKRFCFSVIADLDDPALVNAAYKERRFHRIVSEPFGD